MFRILYMTCVLSLLMASFASGLSLTVNNTLDLPDANPGDYVCQASNGQCTLRAAIDEINSFGPGVHFIDFEVPGMVLSLGSQLNPYYDVTVEGFGAGFTTIEGAGFDIQGSKLTLQGLTVRDAGTAIDLSYDGELIVEDCSFSGNTDHAIDAWSGAVTVTGSTFSSNSTTEKGGAIYLRSPVMNTGLTISGCEFSNNSASQGGGAIYFYVGDVFDIEDTVFDENSSMSNGGAILIESDFFEGRISGCEITDNSGSRGAGIAIEAEAVDLEVSRTNIGFNTAMAGGGGLYFDTTGNTTLSLRNSSVYANESFGAGGGLYSLGSEIVEIVNSTFSLNEAGADGGGLYLSGSLTGALVYSATITQNKADSQAAANNGSGGGIYVESGAGLVYFRNTILAGNEDLSTSPSAFYGPDCYADLASEGYNLIGYSNYWCDLSGGTGDIVGDGASGAIDPHLGTLMMNTGWPTFAHPLLDNSPAIDAADPAGCYDVDGSFLVTDQVGRPRPQGDRADIGAYETGSPVHIFADGFETGDAWYWSEVVGG